MTATANTESSNPRLLSIDTEHASLEEEDTSTEPRSLPETPLTLRNGMTKVPEENLGFDRASLVAASGVVQTLFGAQVGSCWGDFFCTHSRIRGRLFAVTSGVLFYSNLLGFERRLCLMFADIVSITLYRTTSICIEIAEYDSESYIFKSFQNREQVLQLLLGLKRLSDKKKSGKLNRFDVLRTQSEGHENGSHKQWEEERRDQHQQDQERMDLLSSSFVVHTSQSSSNFQFPNAPSPTNRRRAVSDSVVRFLGLQENRPAFARDDLFLLSRTNEMTSHTLKEEWETASREISALEEIGIDSLRLSCSLDKFFCLFLEDGAPYSYDRYQREQIRDRDVVVTAWVDDTVDESLYHSTVSVCSRILTFIHPVKKAMGMGPSEALTTRRQRLRRFPQYGMTVENKTVVEGVPAANTFSVHDFWKIEADGTDCVVLSVNFASRFTKRTLFKSLIEKSILKETNEWFAGYMTMVREALESGVKAISEPRTVLPNQPDINAALFSLLQRWLRTFYPMLVVGLLLLLLILTVLVLQLKDLQGAISMLRDKMLILQQENMQLLLELQHGWTGSASTCNVQADDADAALSNFARAR